MELLREWAGPKKVFKPRYYFWNAVFDILTLCPDLVSQVFPEGWEEALYSRQDPAIWTQEELLQNLKVLLAMDMPHRFCLFIDGLDEYGGDSWDVVQVLRDLIISPDVKICLSSRPWNIFEHAFGSSPTHMLRMQDLTRHDIAIFVSDMLGKNPLYAAMQKVEPDCQEIVRDIVEKSAGVFLWVSLVVKDILRGLVESDTLGDLRNRLCRLPSDLNDFFRYILDSVDNIYAEPSACILSLCNHTDNSLPVSFSTVFDTITSDGASNTSSMHWSQESVLYRNQGTVKRLNARRRGLV
ncbi:hypothetical protein BDV96DRAFT_608493 [Lophiotrema nucula]|uniref:Nephrocystin 3-like N-terminal domain-containing protein n=1 Tax=Lophiotrema nucula TaxID=690887 RepID=A0A6A5ZRX9_9PLEO|nr:hypothetical protein BDV96DRAFT_608493 [Lophiotrema nucula]